MREYSIEFKVTAVRLSQQPGIQVQAVAAALDIHPFMLSRWRKQVREGVFSINFEVQHRASSIMAFLRGAIA